MDYPWPAEALGRDAWRRPIGSSRRGRSGLAGIACFAEIVGPLSAAKDNGNSWQFGRRRSRLAATLSNLAAGRHLGDDGLFQAPPLHLENYQRELPTYPGGMSAPAVFVPNPKFDPSKMNEVPPGKYKL